MALSALPILWERLDTHPERRVPASQTLDGSFKSQEASLLDLGGQLRSDAASRRCLVNDHASASLVHALDDRLDLERELVSLYPRQDLLISSTHIIRHNGAQVDQLDAESTQILRDELLQILARMPQVVQRGLDRVQRRAVRDDGNVFALLEDLG